MTVADLDAVKAMSTDQMLLHQRGKVAALTSALSAARQDYTKLEKQLAEEMKTALAAISSSTSPRVVIYPSDAPVPKYDVTVTEGGDQ